MEQMIHRPDPKVIIKNLETGAEVHALFNPTELSVKKSAKWEKHKEAKGDNPLLEFTAAQPMELSLELLFDAYERRGNVYDDYVKPLLSFMHVMEETKHPPICRLIWGREFPEFTGVITSLSTKYTMFLRDGKPVRATCSITMTQADKVQLKEEQKSGGKKSTAEKQQTSPGTTVQQGDERRPDKHGDDHRKVLDENGSEDGTLKPGQQVSKG